jgi:hypothetical protein
MAGLMVRSTLATEAQNVFVKAFARNNPDGFALSYRRVDGKASKERHRGEVAFPDAWVRLQRVRNKFVAYRSTDGLNWVRIGTAKVNMGPTVLFGLAAASQSTAAVTTTAHFDGLSEVTEAYLLIGKRRIPQRVPTRSLPIDPKPVVEATIELPREGNAHAVGRGQPDPWVSFLKAVRIGYGVT